MLVTSMYLGWLGEELPSALRGMDIIVNPSLRAWSETFCISNIEAMAMKIPLVTFAVGGKK
jgi:glycosyltransferase involved in cell wall biosynthesis